MFRPVGRGELDLVRAADFRRFPPRLPEQPYFYPVLVLEYATQIARDWNTKDERSDYAGYVLRFQVKTEFLSAYPVRQVGDAMHREYWIPAADLPRLNDNLLGTIEIVAEFFGGADAKP